MLSFLIMILYCIDIMGVRIQLPDKYVIISCFKEIIKVSLCFRFFIIPDSIIIPDGFLAKQLMLSQVLLLLFAYKKLH